MQNQAKKEELEACLQIDEARNIASAIVSRYEGAKGLHLRGWYIAAPGTIEVFLTFGNPGMGEEYSEEIKASEYYHSLGPTQEKDELIARFRIPYKILKRAAKYPTLDDFLSEHLRKRLAEHGL